eukprot:jgi/Botrbrau1/4626/Bobra.60_2s0109.1
MGGHMAMTWMFLQTKFLGQSLMLKGLAGDADDGEGNWCDRPGHSAPCKSTPAHPGP